MEHELEHELENYYFDENGLYAGSAPAHEGTLPPANALRAAPEIRDGHWPVLNAARDGWDYPEDHRGEQGWLNGGPIVIDRPGPLPEGWTAAPPEDAASDSTARVPVAEQRRAAYAAGADSFRNTALSYFCEAAAWKRRGDGGKARKATAKYHQALARYLDAKETARLAYPDPADDGIDVTMPDGEFCLNASGVYHRAACCSARSGGEWLNETELRARGDAAKPCGRCRPVFDGQQDGES